MPSPKSGRAGSPVRPAAPDAAQDADTANPGEVVERGGDEAEPFTRQDEERERDNPDRTWIEIELVDEEDQPVPGERYEITLPDGRVARGTLDQNGFARLEGIVQGTCQITFPELDRDAWERI